MGLLDYFDEDSPFSGALFGGGDPSRSAPSTNIPGGDVNALSAPMLIADAASYGIPGRGQISPALPQWLQTVPDQSRSALPVAGLTPAQFDKRFYAGTDGPNSARNIQFAPQSDAGVGGSSRFEDAFDPKTYVVNNASPSWLQHAVPKSPGLRSTLPAAASTQTSFNDRFNAADRGNPTRFLQTITPSDEGSRFDDRFPKLNPNEMKVAVEKTAALPQTDKYREVVRREIDNMKAKGFPTGEGLQRLIVHGMTMNADDEIMAGLATPLEMFKRGTWNPAEAYRYAKAREDMILDDSRKQYGLVGKGAEALGGVLTGGVLTKAGLAAAAGLAPEATLIQKFLANLGDGVAQGAVAGALDGNSLSERLKNAAQYAVRHGVVHGAVGTGLPVALNAVSKYVAPAAKKIWSRVDPGM